MSAARDEPGCSNPFSTRFVRPGALDYQFPAGESEAGLVERLRQSGWRGQIVGPHGTGKSTLLAHLREPLTSAGRRPCVFSLHDGQRRLDRDWTGEVNSQGATLVVIDGYEQLSAWSRLAIGWQCRRRGWGLLVTAHDDVGLPAICRTDSSLPLVEALVARLLGDSNVGIDRETVAECFSAANGNVRDALFALYDRFESLQEPR